jgi:succinate-acetate transporter protein
MLAIADFTGIAMVKTLAGLEGIVCGFSAVYLAAAEVLNEAHGRKILPIGGI